LQTALKIAQSVLRTFGNSKPALLFNKKKEISCKKNEEFTSRLKLPSHPPHLVPSALSNPPGYQT
jgi:hypothetical protein